MNSLGDVIWAMIAFYFVFMCIWIFIRIFADIFRRHDLSGVMKVVWICVLFILPFFGAMVYLIARPKGAEDTEVFPTTTAALQPAAVALQPAAVALQPAAVNTSPADEIAKLATLRDSGAITPAEFDAAKAKALAA